MDRPAAFVLGGGGVHGVSQVGMLLALAEAGVVPDAVYGTSVGAINGAMYAAEPGHASVARLHSLWQKLADSDLFGGSLLAQASTLLRTRTHLHPASALNELLAATLGDVRVEDLALPYQCVAASIERATEQWFTAGPLMEAVLASCAVPGLLPPVEIDGEHFLDGGLVDSIPVGRAVALGARTVYVLQVGRVETPLRPPRGPSEVGFVAFEIARRHRFTTTMANLPDGVAVHVLPAGADPQRLTGLRQLRYRDLSDVPDRIESARDATTSYLRAVGIAP
ncbi:MAG: patatin-like phospholipase family protein [Nocardioidaceae bacterium]|nr:patatin-like phospholipase family protein [Nocardioidaceae bacterium]